MSAVTTRPQLGHPAIQSCVRGLQPTQHHPSVIIHANLGNIPKGEASASYPGERIPKKNGRRLLVPWRPMGMNLHDSTNIQPVRANQHQISLIATTTRDWQGERRESYCPSIPTQQYVMAALCPRTSWFPFHQRSWTSATRNHHFLEQEAFSFDRPANQHRINNSGSAPKGHTHQEGYYQGCIRIPPTFVTSRSAF